LRGVVTPSCHKSDAHAKLVVVRYAESRLCVYGVIVDTGYRLTCWASALIAGNSVIAILSGHVVTGSDR